jgi:hypothetical protein
MYEKKVDGITSGIRATFAYQIVVAGGPNFSPQFLEMKLARQAAAMEELATTIWRDEMSPLRLGSQSQILFAYVTALNSKRLVSSRCHEQNYHSRTAFGKAITDINDEAAMLLDRLDGEGHIVLLRRVSNVLEG